MSVFFSFIFFPFFLLCVCFAFCFIVVRGVACRRRHGAQRKRDLFLATWRVCLPRLVAHASLGLFCPCVYSTSLSLWTLLKKTGRRARFDAPPLLTVHVRFALSNASSMKLATSLARRSPLARAFLLVCSTQLIAFIDFHSVEMSLRSTCEWPSCLVMR